MRFGFLVLFLLCCAFSNGQYQFKGQVAAAFSNQEVHLSLVEDYRKIGRVYLDQIVQSTVADSLGYFSFTGANLPKENRIYRIHVDACDEEDGDKNHFLGSCPHTESILFIANNADQLSLPVGTDERAFCEISSTNPASDALLLFDSLKEEMIVEVLDQPSEIARNLSFKKWIHLFQEFCVSTNEPLTELIAFSFISNRENETYASYLEDLESPDYYQGLLARLETRYPKASFTEQFRKELLAEQTLLETENTGNAGFFTSRLFYLIVFVLLSLGVLYWGVLKKRSTANTNPFDSLSPQERKVLQGIIAGKSNKEIAADFFISVSTVKSHINSLYKKLGMNSRQEILSYYKGKE